MRKRSAYTMLKRSKQSISTVDELVGHLNRVFSARVTADRKVLGVFKPEFLPQLDNYFRANCGRTFDPKAVEENTTIGDLYSLLQTPS